MADTEKIEIEGYGMLSLDENFKVYKTYGSIEEKTIKDVLVGYDTTDFVVADGNVCAALISRTVKADNIRVLIMSTGFTSLFPIVLLIVYFDLSPQIAPYFIGFVIIIAKILLFYKCFSNFFNKFHGAFHLILYFCALEILPDFVLWKGIILANNILVLNF